VALRRGVPVSPAAPRTGPRTRRAFRPIWQIFSSSRCNMRRVIPLGLIPPVGAAAAIAVCLVAGCTISWGSSERALTRAEMLTSFGGQAGYCCGFNPNCLCPATYTQTCASLTPAGQSFCTAVTIYTGNNTQNCQPTDTTLTCGQSAIQVSCSNCYSCEWIVVNGQSQCVQVNNPYDTPNNTILCYTNCSIPLP
jgi:hypothetical protein